MAANSASPVGWTFWSTWLQCPRMWLLRFVRMLVPRTPRDELTLGSCYHSLHEGLSEADIAAMSDDHARLITEAKRLFDARQKGPPMAEASAKEETATVTSGAIANSYTCRFDRRETGTVRELKTAGRVWETTDDYWRVNGEIMGELLALRDAGSPSPKVIVDIITKERLPSVSQVEVTLDFVKERRFNATISRARGEIKNALLNTDDGQAVDDQLLDHYFYANNESCIRFGKKCDFYDLCWGDSRRAVINFVVDKRNGRWRNYLLSSGENHNGKSSDGEKPNKRARPSSKRTRRK